MPTAQEVVYVEDSQGSAVPEIRMARPAQSVIDEAAFAAKALMKMVENTRAFTLIGQKKHLHLEAWQALGMMFRVSARTASTNFVNFGGVQGYECAAELYHIPTGQVIGRAESMCLNDEERWTARPKYEILKNDRGQWIDKDGKVLEKGKSAVKKQVGLEQVPLFQLRSMAQTRAKAKVLRDQLSWVATMGGFAPTAAEEMTGNEHDDSPDPSAQAPKEKPQEKPADAASNGERLITEAQGKRFYAIAKSKNWSDEGLRALLTHFGCESSTKIPMSKYEKIIAELEQGEAQP